MSDHPVRTLTPDDAAEMARLHATSFDPAWPEVDMTEHTTRDLVLGVGQPISSFIILRMTGDQAEILTIVTDPDRRGEGLARTLLLGACRAAQNQGVEIIFLEVAEDNAPAIALYRQSGFEQFGKRPAYYRRPTGRVAALTFRKALDAAQGTG